MVMRQGITQQTHYQVRGRIGRKGFFFITHHICISLIYGLKFIYPTDL